MFHLLEWVYNCEIQIQPGPTFVCLSGCKYEVFTKILSYTNWRPFYIWIEYIHIILIWILILVRLDRYKSTLSLIDMNFLHDEGSFFISWNMKWLKIGETSSDSGKLLKWTEVSFYWQFVGSCRWLGENLKGLLDFGEGLQLFLWQKLHKLHWNKVQYNQMTLLFCRYLCWYWRVKWQQWWQVWIEWSDLSCVCAPNTPLHLTTRPRGILLSPLPFQPCFCLLHLLNTAFVSYNFSIVLLFFVTPS